MCGELMTKPIHVYPLCDLIGMDVTYEGDNK